MTDVKYKKCTAVRIGVSSGDYTAMSEIISHADRGVAVDGAGFVEPFSAINDKTPPDVTHHHRYILVEIVIDGFNYEAIFTQQVEAGVGSSRALRQGADNNPIGYLRVTLQKVGGSDIVEYESGRSYLSGLHLHVSNRKNIKYHPTTLRFKVRGERELNP